MVKTLTAAEMREADRRCIEDLGIPGVVLMHNAGAAVFAEIDRSPLGIVCGKGNNGGDGFVVGRLALQRDWEVRLVLVGAPEEVTGDAAICMQAFEKMGGIIEVVTTDKEAAKAVAKLEGCAILVDALLGTGIQGEVRGAVKAAIEAWPTATRTIAVDLPSGLDTDRGTPCGACVKADLTVSFAFAKRGFLNQEAQPYIGDLVIADIGIPPFCADEEIWATHKQRLNL